MSFMKRFILLFLLLPLCSAQVVNKMNVNVEIFEKDETKVEIYFEFSKLREIQIPVYADLYDLKSENGACVISSGVQKVISCKPDIGYENMKISFISKSLVKAGNINLFSYDVPITAKTNQIEIKLDLPIGHGLTDKVVVPVSPPNTEVGTDGRKIFVKWDFYNKEADDLIPLRVYYEKTSSSAIPSYYGMIIAASVSVAIILLVVYLRVLRKKPELVLSVLNEAERMVVEIIQNQPEDEVDQRKIVTLSGFSKAKVSRILQSLEERGVIESIRLGRKNKIKLKKKFIKEETEQSEK